MIILKLAIFSQLLFYVYCWRSYSLISRNLTGEGNPDYIEHLNLNGKQQGSKISIAANATLIKDLQRSVIVKVIAYEFKNEEYVQNFINATQNLCDYYKKPTSYPLVHIMYPLFAKNGNFPKKCPIKKGSYHGFLPQFDSDRLPPYMPGEDWRVDIILYDEEVKVFHVNWYIKLDHSRAVNGFKAMNRG